MLVMRDTTWILKQKLLIFLCPKTEKVKQKNKLKKIKKMLDKQKWA